MFLATGGATANQYTKLNGPIALDAKPVAVELPEGAR